MFDKNDTLISKIFIKNSKTKDRYGIKKQMIDKGNIMILINGT